MTLEPRGDVVRLSAGNWIALVALVVPILAGLISMKIDISVVQSKQDDAKEAAVQQRITQERMDERILRIERIVKQP